MFGLAFACLLTCPDFTLFALMPMFGYKGEGIKENTPILDLTLVAAYLFGPISRFHLSCLVFIYSGYLMVVFSNTWNFGETY